MYIDKLDDLVNEYNNTYHKTIKIKPIDLKSSADIDFNVENNDKGLTFEFGNFVRIWKYKNIFAKGYTQNCSEGVFLIKKVKNTEKWTYVIEDLNSEKILGTFYGKELQKTNETEFRIEKVIKKKGDELYVKWKSYDNSFNS